MFRHHTTLLLGMCALLWGCRSSVLSTGSVGYSERRTKVPEITRYRLFSPRYETYDESQAVVLEGLSESDHGNPLCRADSTLEREDFADGSGMSCVIEQTGVLEVGGDLLLLGLLDDHHEHDGMYGQYYGIVAGLGELHAGECCAVTPVAVFTQWNHDVYDGETSVTQQAQRVLDLDGDGTTELCVEQIVESGPGLFELMDMEDRDEAWTPHTSRRALLAYIWRPIERRFEHAAHLDDACPDTGYRAFIPIPPYDDPVGWRFSRP